MIFSQRLRELLKEKGVTWKEISSELEIGKNQQKYWEDKDIAPDGKTLMKLCEYFGVTSDYLLGIDRERINTLQEKALNILDDSDVTLTYDEKWFIRKLRSLDKEGRTMVESALIAECRRMEAAGKGETANVG